MSTARTIRRFTDEPVADAVLARCIEAATWAPSGANAQAWRFVVLRSPQQRAVVAESAAQAVAGRRQLRPLGRTCTRHRRRG
jgi:nitroreductase